MQPVVHIPNTVLTHPAKPVRLFDKKLMGIIKDMKETLIAATNPKGVGLAAPQIGLPLRIFVTRPTEKSGIRVFINPEIIETSQPEKKKENGSLEGCLSIPTIWGDVTRAPKLTLRYQDETGIEHTEIITGFLATIVQHETDHINGILFTQRVLEQHGKFYQTSTDDQGKEVLEEVTIA